MALIGVRRPGSTAVSGVSDGVDWRARGSPSKVEARAPGSGRRQAQRGDNKGSVRETNGSERGTSVETDGGGNGERKGAQKENKILERDVARRSMTT